MSVPGTKPLASASTSKFKLKFMFGMPLRGGVMASLILAGVAPTRTEEPTPSSVPAITRVDPPEHGFYAKRLDYEGIAIKAPTNVVDEALFAGSNHHEFFAELSMWYFGTRGDLNMKGARPANGREDLQAYDPELLGLRDGLPFRRQPAAQECRPRSTRSSPRHTSACGGTATISAAAASESADVGTDGYDEFRYTAPAQHPGCRRRWDLRRPPNPERFRPLVPYRSHSATMRYGHPFAKADCDVTRDVRNPDVPSTPCSAIQHPRPQFVTQLNFDDVPELLNPLVSVDDMGRALSSS